MANILFPTDTTFPVNSNEPIGIAQGLNPGRVVWIMDSEATNENYVPQKGSSDLWYSNDNADEFVINSMLELSIMKYSGVENISDAWDAIFRSFNQSHGKGDLGYTTGEKIAFKINLTNQSSSDSERPLRMDATPQLLNAILNQLVNVVGVAQADITMGDPYREFREEYRDLVMSKYPYVYYVDGAGGNGVNKTVPSTEEVLVFSDGQYKSTLPQQFLDAAYVINIPCLKTHNAGGITLIAKNHQGSFLEKGDDPKSQYAGNMHYSLPSNSNGTGKYRHTVDYMGHEETGGKGLIYIVDGIWGGEDWQGWIKKFKSDPFNDDYPNSILVSQDPVALESVCFDILFNEDKTNLDNADDFPIVYKNEVADHLSQCASSDFWPSDIKYDPEGDGVSIGSLGVFEHWNNPTDRQYSRNLGTGNGIELITNNSIIINYCDSANITISYSVKNETCEDSNDGEIDIEVNGSYPEFTYEWSNGSSLKNLKDLIPDTYLIKTIDSKGCSKSESITITEATPFLIQEITGENEVVESQTYTYSVSNDELFNYQWTVKGGNVINGQGTNVVEIQWGSEVTGKISAFFESEKGCFSDTSYLDISINPTGIKNIDKSKLSIYPNPTSDIITVETNILEPYSISIYTTNGKLLFESCVEEASLQIDLSKLPKGVYYLNLATESSTITKKVIKL